MAKERGYLIAESARFILGWNLIVRVKWVLRRIIGGEWRFNILSGCWNVTKQNSPPQDNLVPRAFLRQGESELLGGEKPWERGCLSGLSFSRTIKFHPRMGTNHFLLSGEIQFQNNGGGISVGKWSTKIWLQTSRWGSKRQLPCLFTAEISPLYQLVWYTILKFSYQFASLGGGWVPETSWIFHY